VINGFIENLMSGKHTRHSILEELLRLRRTFGLPGYLVPLIPDLFVNESRYIFSLEELLRYEGEAFVINMYRQLLRRMPDQLGLRTNVEALMMGAATREALIRKLLDSDEALRVGVSVIGVNARLPDGGRPGDWVEDSES